MIYSVDCFLSRPTVLSHHDDRVAAAPAPASSPPSTIPPSLASSLDLELPELPDASLKFFVPSDESSVTLEIH
jgi:hypothetical protein